MKFRWSLVFLILIVIVSCTDKAITIKNDLSLEDIRGQVKSVSIQTYKAIEKFGQIQEGPMTDVKTKTYDTRGYIIDTDELIRHNTYKYIFNEENLPVERNTFNSDSSLAGKETYAYGEKSNKIMANIFSPNGQLQVKTLFKYDEKGNVIEENNYDSLGALLSKFIYKYNSNGKRVAYNGYRENGQLMNRFLYKFDENGNIVQENQILLNTDDSSFSATTINYTYPELDKAGNWTKQLVLNEEKTATLIRTREIIYY